MPGKRLAAERIAGGKKTAPAADTLARRRAWQAAIAALALAILVIGGVCRESLAGAVRVWIGSTAYNHCFLVIPIAAYMGWTRRKRLMSVLPQTEWRALGALAVLTLVWFAGAILGVLEIRQFAVVTMFQAMALAMLGWPVYRRLMAPFLYLYFLIPAGDFLVPSLQVFTAQFATYGLQLIGIPVFNDGTIIEIPAGNFAVAEACAGLRFLVATVAFAVFYACEIFAGNRKRLIFIAASFVLPILANGLRAFGLIAAAQTFGSAAAIMADHILYGWIFFSIVLAALMLTGRLFADRDPFVPYPAGPAAEQTASAANILNIAAVAMLGVMLAASGPVLAKVMENRSGLAIPSAPPPVPPGWHRIAGVHPDWMPKIVGAGAAFQDTIGNGVLKVDRFVALYSPHGPASNLIRSDDRVADPGVWRLIGQNLRTVAMAEGRGEVSQSAVSVFSRRRVIWSFYALDGTISASLWKTKWHQARGYLSGSRCLSAFVAISEEKAGADISNADALAAYLKAMPSLSGYLCGR